MIEIGKTIVSLDLFREKFVCDLEACKGECCVQGDAGAPLEKEELDILKKIYPIVQNYLRPEGIAAIEKQGVFIVDEDGDFVTPLVNGKECAYTVFDKNGVAQCGIELAYQAGGIDFQKPISCHLYPVRLKEYRDFTAVQYHRWEICSAACSLGERNKIPLYKFLKEPLIRKFGKAWYEELEKVAEAYFKEQG